MSVSKDSFKNMTLLVIDKLEGGYYNPLWHSTGDVRYSSSGETMFGIDRRNAGTIDDTIAGQQFWKIIDSNKSKDVWKWNYKGGDLAPQLKSLTADIMYPVYERNSSKYLSLKAKQIVDSDNRLLFHFIYAIWNGTGWFKKFASDINKAVEEGITDTDKLVQIAIDSRTKEGLKEGSRPNSLVAQGGAKIAKLFTTFSRATIETVKKKPLLTILITALVVVSVYNIYKLLKTKKA